MYKARGIQSQAKWKSRAQWKSGTGELEQETVVAVEVDQISDSEVGGKGGTVGNVWISVSVKMMCDESKGPTMEGGEQTAMELHY